MRRCLEQFLSDQSGATAIEYGLIISLVFIVIVTAVTAFGNTASSIFNTAMYAVRDAV
jgi:pilus assembly protein Flp/PilA